MRRSAHTGCISSWKRAREKHDIFDSLTAFPLREMGAALVARAKKLCTTS